MRMSIVEAEAGTGILDRLRRETRAPHARLEARVQIERRVCEVALYADFLEKLFGFYQPQEQRLQALAGWEKYGVDLAERWKTPWLRHDLAALGRTDRELEELPRCRALPAVHDLAQGFGCAYVLEGATLGGRHISRLLGESAVPAGARQFFSSYGSRVGELWTAFVAALESFAAHSAPAERDRIVATARDTFSRMEAWVCREE